MSKCIIIAGVHRSGTSYLSRCMVDAGIPMWKTDGGDHAECQRLLAINERELSRQGLTFRDVSQDPIPNQDFISELMDYKSQREGEGAPVYGFKEPRIASLIDAYLHVWPDALYVVSVRNPLGAGASWHNRGNCRDAREGSILLMNQYTHAMSAISNGSHVHRWTTFNYDKPSWETLSTDVYAYCSEPVDFETSWRGRR